jgi:hypothetical protein
MNQSISEADRHTTSEVTWGKSDQECHDSWYTWRSSTRSWLLSCISADIASGHYTLTSSSYKGLYTLQQGIGNGSVYTDCDKIPRFMFHSPPTSSTLTTMTATHWRSDKLLNSTLWELRDTAFSSYITSVLTKPTCTSIQNTVQPISHHIWQTG